VEIISERLPGKTVTAPHFWNAFNPLKNRPGICYLFLK